MDLLFGPQVPMAFRMLVALLIVLALIGFLLLILRRFGVGRIAGLSTGRVPRLQILDVSNLDGKRRLVIVRRDHVEHLLMIGGPNDVVIETGFQRQPTSQPRDEKNAPAAAAIATDISKTEAPKPAASTSPFAEKLAALNAQKRLEQDMQTTLQPQTEKPTA